MAGEAYRIGIVGASSLAGKELADSLSESSLGSSSIVLLEGEELSGTVTAAGDEVSFIQKLDASSFEAMDVAFFAGAAELAKLHWQGARSAGAGIVDLTYALEGQNEVRVRSPWLEEAFADSEFRPVLGPAAVVVAHPAAVMLALIAARLLPLNLKVMAATIMQPASESGRLAMDELQEQAVNLLSFQPLAKEQYDAQIAFNLLPGLGEAAKIEFAATARRISRHYEVLGAGRLPELTLQLVQAPVFHGYTASVLIELTHPATTAQVEFALAGVHVDIVTTDSDPPSNLTVAGQGEIQVRVAEVAQASSRLWIWMAADNLKLHALNGIACAADHKKMRPVGTVQ